MLKNGELHKFSFYGIPFLTPYKSRLLFIAAVLRYEFSRAVNSSESRGEDMTEQYAIECRQITKVFGSVVANDKIDLSVKYGEIMALLGENGSGKTTLMNMISGIYHPDSGSILVGGKEVAINSPVDSRNLGIGMIHQHFKLVDVFSAMDNIVLGTSGKRLGRKALKEKIEQISQSFGLEIEPEKKIFDMSVSEKQTVEILKVLYRGAQILILDEPTAVLTPQETDKLFAILRKMKEQGCAIIIITHKLHEVLSISDRVTILRKGQSIETVKTAECNEKKLTELMVGRPVTLNIERPEIEKRETILKVVDLTVDKSDGSMALDDVSFEIKTGEILGVAGVAGSGQRELLESIAGLYPIASGSVTYYDPADGKTKNLVGMDPMDIRKSGIAMSFVPEDRLGMGLVGSMGMIDNMMLKSYGQGHSPIADRRAPRHLAEEIKEKSITVKIQAGVEGKVFGSISSKEIATEAKKQLNMDIDKKKIVIPDAIKSLGTYNVNIKLHKDVTATLTVKVEAK